jgi:lipoate-protein ligase A
MARNWLHRLPIADTMCDNSLMRLLDLTLPTPAENLALDEALVEWAEAENPRGEFLRIWESRQPMVVVGRSSRVHQEVDEAACRERRIPILRRASGGAAVVAGPGSLMYAIVLSYARRPELKDIRRAHTFVLGRLAESLLAIAPEIGDIAQAGTSDLVVLDRSAPPSPRKFSGNSMRAKRTHFLYHGTLLYDFDLALIESLLRSPPRQPDYRQRRPHAEFVSNLPLPRSALVDALMRAWPTDGVLENWPAALVASLVDERFRRDEWNLEFP